MIDQFAEQAFLTPDNYAIPRVESIIGLRMFIRAQIFMGQRGGGIKFKWKFALRLIDVEKTSISRVLCIYFFFRQRTFIVRIF